VGPRDQLRTRNIKLAQVNWLGDGRPETVVCRVKVRSTRGATPARVSALAGNAAEVELMDGEDAVAPGQACVFYEENGTRVLGGGWITKTEPVRAAA
jgi:tRNA-specific 2-thiouridylase